MWRIQNLPDAIARQPPNPPRASTAAPHLNLNIFKPTLPRNSQATLIPLLIKNYYFSRPSPLRCFLPSFSLPLSSLPATETGRGGGVRDASLVEAWSRGRAIRVPKGLAIPGVARPGWLLARSAVFCGFPPLTSGGFGEVFLLGASVDWRRAEVLGRRFEAAGAEIPRGAAVLLRPVR